MLTFRHQHDHYHHHPDLTEVKARMEQLRGLIVTIIHNQETTMIDTSKILAEVAREHTVNGSLRALVTGLNQTVKDSAAQLKDAIDKLAAQGADIAAATLVQADLDAAATTLSLDNAETEAKIAENTPPVTPPTPVTPV